MYGDENEYNFEWYARLTERLDLWWETNGENKSLSNIPIKYWKTCPWVKPRRSERLSIRHLDEQVNPGYPFHLCWLFTWELREWIRHTSKFSLYPGAILELRIAVVQLDLCTSYLKREFRDIFDQFRGIAVGILQEIDEHIGTL